MKKQFYRSSDLNRMIRDKYPSPAWVVLHELRDGTGFNTAGRSADAIAFGTWPSRGLAIIGFENKSYRGDWLNELKNPEKAESIARFCDSWYLVCSEDVAKLEEIPLAWGWLCPTAKGLKVMKDPIPKEPQPISKIFFMSIMRSLEKNYVTMTSVEERVKVRVENEINQRASSLIHLQENYDKLKKRVQEFKETSGLDIEEEWRFPIKELGRAVKAVINYDEYLSEKVNRAETELARIQETCESLKALKMINIKEVDLQLKRHFS